MDNPSLAEKWAMDAYKDGLRAVLRSGGKYYCRPSVNGGKYVMGVKTEAFWHALRAYQDAERKKGTPILWDDIANDFMEDFNTDYQTPIGRMDGTFILKAWTDLTSKSPHGQFTNFRWRAGYPKGGSHDA